MRQPQGLEAVVAVKGLGIQRGLEELENEQLNVRPGNEKGFFFVFPETHQVVVAEVQLQEDLEVPVLTQKKKYQPTFISLKKSVSSPTWEKKGGGGHTQCYFSLSLRHFFFFPLGEKRRVQIFASSFSLLAS